MTFDVLNTDSPDWMTNPNLPCVQIRPESNTPTALRLYGASVDERWAPDGARLEERAKRNCAGCPEMLACLTYALDDPELRGIWGGTSEADRAELRQGGGADAA